MHKLSACMKHPLMFALSVWLLLPLAAQDDGGPPSLPVRAYFGVVAYDGDSEPGTKVISVAPASPAAKAGICEGDKVLRIGQISINSRDDLRMAVAKAQPGDVLVVELQRGGGRLVFRVMLEPRLPSASRSFRPEAALGADRRIRPIELPDAIRQEIRRHRRLLRQQLASLPEGLQPSFVIAELNAIRDLARDAHASRPGWMSGRAGEISVRFRDEDGSVVLYGANNLLSLELYNVEGKLYARYDINTEEERRALPEGVLERLRRLQRFF